MSSCYFARLAPENGFDIAVGAFIELARQHPEARFHVGGWLAEKDRAFYEVRIERIAAAGLSDRFRHVVAPDGASKMAFLEEIDVFTVPARFVEPKGLSGNDRVGRVRVALSPRRRGRPCRQTRGPP